MSYGEMYQYAQTLRPVVKTRALIAKASALRGIGLVPTFYTNMQDEACRGCFAMPGDGSGYHEQFGKNAPGTPIIVIRRELNVCWQRFVLTKELMHLFDTDIEKVNTPADFSNLVDEFATPSPQRSAAMGSEVNAFWMALAVLCPESNRLEFAQANSDGRMSSYQIANILKIPEQYVPALFDPNYKRYINGLCSKY